MQGGSTLTMQLVGNVYLPESIADHHDLRYKIVQAKLANELEDKESKMRILTQYLNDVPYGTVGGQSAYGVGAASQMFFNKPVQKLDLAQIGAARGVAAGALGLQPVPVPQPRAPAARTRSWPQWSAPATSPAARRGPPTVRRCRS